MRSLSWTAYNTTGTLNVWVADISPSLGLTSIPTLNTLNDSDFTVAPTRLFRAMYPNYDIEQFSGSLPDMHEVVEWLKPPVMDIPTLFYKDLFGAGLKNDSTMAVSGWIG